MHRIPRASATGLVTAILCCILAIGALHAAEGVADSAEHVLVTITVGGQAQARQYQLVVAEGGETARLFTGSRVPIPTTTFQSETEPTIPVTSYTYQNVGFAARVRSWSHDGKIKLDADIEESHIAPSSAEAAQPIVLSSQQTVQLLLNDGEPMRILRADDSADEPGYLEFKAEVVR